uniref:Sirohydrochlorin cobaltochelatase n=1 Tax=Craspedostauros australis TaxID=1486917 RepID=A0A7R9ZPY0_9STRA|mmetsp:Transcript_24156/g.67349  ORF Transcript_24156/g.67349 Transcript_24156/m.67349 type:complete len:323 (+) Transcript_24156:72-1040(+)
MIVRMNRISLACVCAGSVIVSTQAWTTAPSVVSLLRQQRHASLCMASNDKEPDLFEYFDPLLSPHAYPQGISPDTKPKRDAAVEKKEAVAQSSGEEETPKAPSVESSPGGVQQDLFEYFDPLKSPHEYPNGIGGATQDKPKKDSPLRLTKGIRRNQQSSPARNTVPSRSGKMGILLMDHGSKNPASNERLLKLAELYQLTIDDDSIVVKAAHMEIVPPFIPDGLQALLDEGVDEIICHPYFLSPGRHVTKDIPEIMSDAIQDMNIEIPIVITDPVGSNTQLMIGAIHSLVRESATTLRAQKVNTQNIAAPEPSQIDKGTFIQ